MGMASKKRKSVPSQFDDCAARVRFVLEMMRAKALVEDFRDARKGRRLLHPHFDVVREDMAELIKRGKARDLPTAYRMACAKRRLPTWTRR